MVSVTSSHHDKWWIGYCIGSRRLCELMVERIYEYTKRISSVEGFHLFVLYYFNLLPGHR